MRVCILVAVSDNLPVYASLLRLWRKYATHDSEHVCVYFMRADPNLPVQTQLDGDTIWTKTQECTIPGLINKTVESLKFILNQQSEEKCTEPFDFFVRTNLSSFWVFSRLLQYLQSDQVPKTGFIQGCMGKHNALIPFVSTSGLIMSADVAQCLTDPNHRDALWNNGIHPDCVVIGEFLSCKGFALTPYPQQFDRVGLSSMSECVRWKQMESMGDATKSRANFQFRIRTNTDRAYWEPFIQSQLLQHFYPVKSSQIRVCVLHIASDDLPVYGELAKLIRSYKDSLPENVSVYFVRGNPDQSKSCQLIDRDTISVKTSESHRPGILVKRVESTRFMLTDPQFPQFDYFVHTNISTFWVYNRLVQYLDHCASRTNFYHGFAGRHDNIPFISGAGITMSKDVAQKLTEMANCDTEVNLFDDVAMAVHLQKCGVPPIAQNRGDFHSIPQFHASFYQIKDYEFQYRVKALSPVHRHIEDIFIQQSLIKYFYPSASAMAAATNPGLSFPYPDSLKPWSWWSLRNPTARILKNDPNDHTGLYHSLLKLLYEIKTKSAQEEVETNQGEMKMKMHSVPTVIVVNKTLAPAPSGSSQAAVVLDFEQTERKLASDCGVHVEFVDAETLRQRDHAEKMRVVEAWYGCPDSVAQSVLHRFKWVHELDASTFFLAIPAGSNFNKSFMCDPCPGRPKTLQLIVELTGSSTMKSGGSGHPLSKRNPVLIGLQFAEVSQVDDVILPHELIDTAKGETLAEANVDQFLMLQCMSIPSCLVFEHEKSSNN